MADDIFNDGKIRRMVDSTAAIAFARFFMPIVLAIVGALALRIMNTFDSSIARVENAMVSISADHKETTRAVWLALGKMSDRLTALETETAVTKVRVENLTLKKP